MIDYEKLKSWLLERCKDESEFLQLLKNHPQTRDMIFGDECEHESSPIEFYNKRPVTWKCLKCGECYK